MSVPRLLSFAALTAGLFVVAPGARLAASPAPAGVDGLIAHYNGGVPGPCSCINLDQWMGGDIPAAVCGAFPPAPAVRPGPPIGNNAVMVIGASWGPTLVFGHPHGTGGPVSFRIRMNAINGPCIAGPCGLPYEVLTSGTLLHSSLGFHNGFTAVVPSLDIPNDVQFVGLTWACQATVVGGGVCDASSALLGVIGDEF